MVDRCLGWLASFTEQRWLPSACLAVITLWTAFFIFLAYGAPALFPEGEGLLGGVVEDLRTLCLGWDPRTGTYRLAVMLMVLMPAPFLVALVAFVWPQETAALARRVVRAVSSRAGIAVLLLLVAGLAVLVAGRDRAALKRGWEPVPDFRLTDTYGEAFSLRDLRGSVVLLTFTYGHCQETCPTILRRVDEVMARTGEPAVRAVSITVDPERDTPTSLHEATRTWGLRDDAWTFLTGEPSAVEAVLGRYAVGRKRDPVTGMISHTNVLAIIDREGRLSYRVDPQSTGVLEMAELVRRLGD